MKDAYSFHATPESLQEGYQAMYDAYCRIFNRCGVEYIIVQAESGQMGGSGSHQFTVPCETGEDLIVYTEDGSYAANLQKAAADPLPKQTLSSQTPPPQDVHTPNVGSIDAVCSFLKTKPQEMIKTLIYSAGDELITVLVRGDHEVNPEKLTQTMKGKYIELADETTIRNVTGAATGFAGPVGIIEKIDKLLIDHAVANMAVGITGANKTDYHTQNIVPGRDFPLTGHKVVVTDLRNVVEGDTYNGKKLLFRHGIEVGQVFKLGAKYSNVLGARFLDED
jgi:prolyl-tRNA synthetase